MSHRTPLKGRKKKPDTCIHCGCTDERACLGGCFWISLDPHICSRCVPKEPPIKNWDAWWIRLKQLAAPIKYPFAEDFNRDAWREYFDDGYSPIAALTEDISYCDD